MADVKLCSRCGTSISGQAIIDGQAKLVGGELVCAECVSKAPASPEPVGAGQDPLKLDVEAEEGGEEITIFGGAEMDAEQEEKSYRREPSATGQGAVRVKTFDTKLSRSAFAIMDQMINEWLDETGYEVKHVTSAIGDIHGKTTTEPHLIINVWY